MNALIAAGLQTRASNEFRYHTVFHSVFCFTVGLRDPCRSAATSEAASGEALDVPAAWSRT
jgi:hypothetical protein